MSQPRVISSPYTLLAKVAFPLLAVEETIRYVEDVRQRHLVMNAIVIHVARDTEFGKRIAFVPRGRYRFISWTHPMVDRLRDAVAAAKKTGTVR